MNAVYLALLAGAIVLIQCLIGGTRLLYSLPAYALIAAAAAATLFELRRTRPSLPRLSCLAASALLFAYILVRAAFSPIDYLWWPDFYMVIACLMAYLLVAHFLTGTKQRSFLAAVLLALAVAEVLIAFRQFTQGDDWMPFNFIRPPSGRRASGMFISSIHLAGYLEAVAGLALGLACWSRWPLWARIAAGYITAVCYAGVAITGSRGGYLSVAFSLAAFSALSLWVIWKIDRRRALLTAVWGGAGVAILAVAGVTLMSQNPMIRGRLDLLQMQFGGQLDVRIHNWQAALDQFHTAPAWGTGAGTHLYYGRAFRRPQIQSDPVHAHSDYLELLAEYGIAGAVGMLLFLAAHLRSGVRAVSWLVREDLEPPYFIRSDALAFQIGCLTAVASYLAHSVVDFNLHIPGNALLFAVIFGMLANPGLADESNSGRARAMAGAFRFALPALAAWMCASGLPKLPGEYWTDHKTRIALRNRDFQGTLRYGAKALEWQKRNPELYFYIGEANRALGTMSPLRTLRTRFFEAAAEAYRCGLKIFPSNELLWVRLGQALDGLKEFQEAETAYLTAINLDPNLGVLYGYYAAHLNVRGRADQAREMLEKGGRLSAENLAPIVENALDAPEQAAAPR